MKKILISLTLIVSFQTTAIFGAMVPFSNPLAQSLFNETPAIGIESHNTRIIQVPQSTGNFFTLDASILQIFLASRGVNVALEKSRLMEAHEVVLDDIQNILEKIAIVFDSMAQSDQPKGLLGFVKKLRRYFTKSSFEKDVEWLVSQAQQTNQQLRVRIQYIYKFESIVLPVPSIPDFYKAIASLVRNLKTIASLKSHSSTCPANIFDFALRVEPVNMSKLDQVKKITPTIAHTLAYCRRNKKCSKSCDCLKVDCTKTIERTVCALEQIQRYYFEQSNSKHMRKIYTTILLRSQLHVEYDEFFHAYNGKIGILFDVITELMRHTNLIDKDNPSPLFMRFLNEKFNRHGPNVKIFLEKTVTSFKNFDHDDLARELELSANVALAGNLFSSGENTLSFFFKNFSISTPDLNGKLQELFNALHLPVRYVDKIIALYNEYPELKVGHLCQFFIPRKALNDCVYLSYAGGIPLLGEPFPGSTVSPSKVFYLLPSLTEDHFDIVNNIQARILLNPQIAKNFIVYRYYATDEAAKAAELWHKQLSTLIDSIIKAR